nr:GNAT family N-acetyltransferase [uncultured Bacteroides sp.]
MFEIRRYDSEYADEWDSFVENSKNGTFIFLRNYMDYHSDRFHDNSLMIYRKGKLYTLLPANRVDDVLYSHQGLTHGGFIMSVEVTAMDMVRIFELLNEYLKNIGIRKVIYKPIPSIYHQMPAQEDLYALFKNNAVILARNVSSTIFQKNKIKFYKMRRLAARKAQENNVVISESDDYAAFWNILEENLKDRHHTKPVHTLDEILLLHSRFPDNIKLYLTYINEIPLGGVVVYITKQVVHPQYCSATAMGKELGVLDLLFDYLINTKYTDVPVFDFGQSTEHLGCYLNEGLIFQKEGLGARALMYDIYEYSVSPETEDELSQRVVFEWFNECYLNSSYHWLKDSETRQLMDIPDFTRTFQHYWFKSLQERYGYLIWGVRYDGKRIGCCGLKNVSFCTAEFWGFIGEKSYWGMGIGKVMLKKCINMATELKLCRIYLKVLPENKRAINLYSRLDFNIYNKDDDYIYMERKL